MGRQIALGIDLGGTKIRAGLVDSTGALIGAAESIPTHARERDGEEIYASILALARRQIAMCGERVCGIGIGSTGPLDFKKGTILDCDNLPSMNYFPLVERLSGDLGIKVRLDNDANTFLLGEAKWGAAAGHRDVVGLTLGTGLGMAQIANGVLVRGAHDCAGEVWTSPYKEGIIEQYVSGSALGGPDASQIAFDAFAEDLSRSLAWIVNICDPSVVVLGGSVMKSQNRFLPLVKERVLSYICSSVASSLRIKEAALGDDAGMMGAASLLFE